MELIRKVLLELSCVSPWPFCVNEPPSPNTSKTYVSASDSCDKAILAWSSNNTNVVVFFSADKLDELVGLNNVVVNQLKSKFKLSLFQHARKDESAFVRGINVESWSSSHYAIIRLYNALTVLTLDANSEELTKLNTGDR